MLLRVYFTDTNGEDRWGFYCNTRVKSGVVSLVNTHIGSGKCKPKKYKTKAMAWQGAEELGRDLRHSKTIAFSINGREQKLSILSVGLISLVDETPI